MLKVSQTPNNIQLHVNPRIYCIESELLRSGNLTTEETVKPTVINCVK